MSLIIKSNLFMSATYLIATFFLSVCIYKGENIVSHLYWTRLAIFILLGISAVWGIATFINKVLIKNIRSNFISKVETAIESVYVVLLVICMSL